MTSVRLRVLAALAAGFVLSGLLRSVNAQAPELPVRMNAFLVNMTNVATGANAIVEITVDRLSTAEERKSFIETMQTKGQDGLLKAFQKASVKGRIRIPGWNGPDPNNIRLGWDLRYATREPLPEGGQRFVLATDRYMSMLEIRNQPRTVDYPFTILEIRFPREGKGTGAASVYTQVLFDKKKNLIELERYSAGTTHLNEVTLEKK
jgi:hypothetical protein